MVAILPAGATVGRSDSRRFQMCEQIGGLIRLSDLSDSSAFDLAASLGDTLCLTRSVDGMLVPNARSGAPINV